MDVALIMNHNENFSQKFSTLFILSFICLFNLILINLDLEGNISISNEESFTDSIDDYSNIRQLQHKPDEDDTQYKSKFTLSKR